MFVGSAVAVEAPAHAQGLVVHDHRHLIDLAVTAHASNPAADVNRVVEVNVVRGPVNAYPGNRLPARKTRPDHLEPRAVRLDRLVAVHAGLGWRYPRDRRFLGPRMTVQARHSQLPRMLLVRERDRLLRRVTDSRVLGGAVIEETGQTKSGREYHADGKPAEPEVCLVGEDKGQTSLLGFLEDRAGNQVMRGSLRRILRSNRRSKRTPS